MIDVPQKFVSSQTSRPLSPKPSPLLLLLAAALLLCFSHPVQGISGRAWEGYDWAQSTVPGASCETVCHNKTGTGCAPNGFAEVNDMVTFYEAALAAGSSLTCSQIAAHVDNPAYDFTPGYVQYGPGYICHFTSSAPASCSGSGARLSSVVFRLCPCEQRRRRLVGGSALAAGQPTLQPTGQPTRLPTTQPSVHPTNQPTSPTGQPSSHPTFSPTLALPIVSGGLGVFHYYHADGACRSSSVYKIALNINVTGSSALNSCQWSAVQKSYVQYQCGINYNKYNGNRASYNVVIKSYRDASCATKPTSTRVLHSGSTCSKVRRGGADLVGGGYRSVHCDVPSFFEATRPYTYVLTTLYDDSSCGRIGGPGVQTATVLNVCAPVFDPAGSGVVSHYRKLTWLSGVKSAALDVDTVVEMQEDQYAAPDNLCQTAPTTTVKRRYASNLIDKHGPPHCFRDPSNPDLFYKHVHGAHSVTLDFPRMPSPQPTTAHPTRPTVAPTAQPTQPTALPTAPSAAPTALPTTAPSPKPTLAPTSLAPTLAPTTSVPTILPTFLPTAPTANPSALPTPTPTEIPTVPPSPVPSAAPSALPTSAPTTSPTPAPSALPTPTPTQTPTARPSPVPSTAPSALPTVVPTSPTPAPSPFRVTRGLVMSLDAATYSGTGNWIDTVGGLSFAFSGTTSFSSTFGGGSFAFTASSSASAQSTTALPVMTVWTLEAWFYHTNVFLGGTLPMLISDARQNCAGCTAYTNSNYYLGGKTGLTAGYFQSSTFTTATTTTTLVTNSWNHVAATFDGANLVLYLNNVLQSTTAMAGVPTTPSLGVRLMRRFDSASYDFYGGSMSIAKIYNTALTAAEVSNNWHADASRRFGLATAPSPAPTAGPLTFTITAAAPAYNTGSFVFSNIASADAACWIGPDRLTGNTYNRGGDPTFFFVANLGGVRTVSVLFVQQCAAWYTYYGASVDHPSARTDVLTPASVSLLSRRSLTHFPALLPPLPSSRGRDGRVSLQRRHHFRDSRHRHGLYDHHDQADVDASIDPHRPVLQGKFV